MDDTSTISPTPKKETPVLEGTVTYDLPAVISQVLTGKKIHKLEWGDKEFYGFLNNGALSLHKPDGQTYLWNLSDGDLRGTDYIIL